MKPILLLGLIIPFAALAQDYSLQFDAASRVETADNPVLNPDYITVELWVKPGIPQPGDSAEQILLQKGGGAETQYSLFLSRLKPEISALFQGNIVYGLQLNTELKPLLWHHLAFTYDGNHLYLSVNGANEPLRPIQSSLMPGTGMVFIGGDTSGNNFRGNIDGARISAGARYAGSFDPFTGDMNGILPFDREISAWHYGDGMFDHMEADDSTSLYLIIDGAAEIYLDYNFQYAIYQMYYELGGAQRDLIYWLTDQGDSANAAGLYHDQRIAVGEYRMLQGIGDAARLDTSLLFDIALDMYYGRYYLSVTTGQAGNPQAAARTLMDFAENSARAMRFLRAQDTDSSVALWYMFSEGAGSTAYDSSHYGNNGTIIGAAWDQGFDFTYPFYIVSAIASDGDVVLPGIDDDDYVTLRFNILFTDPPQIAAAELDSLLTLSGGGSWLSGSGAAGEIIWTESDSGHILRVNLSTTGGAPTIAPGDTIFPRGIFNAAGKEIESLAALWGAFGPSGVGNPTPRPADISISPPYPNPFNCETEFKVRVDGKPETVTLEVFNLLGERVERKIFREVSGALTVRWDAEQAASGLYFAKITAGKTGCVKKLVLMK